MADRVEGAVAKALRNTDLELDAKADGPGIYATIFRSL